MNKSKDMRIMLLKEWLKEHLNELVKSSELGAEIITFIEKETKELESSHSQDMHALIKTLKSLEITYDNQD